VTTDATGSFGLTGDYACTPGNPVYIAAVGGSPSYPSVGDTFPINKVVVSTSGAQTIYTFSLTQGGSYATELFYIGEPVAFNGFTGALAGLNTATTGSLLTPL
jgi:hypothetical protein